MTVSSRRSTLTRLTPLILGALLPACMVVQTVPQGTRAAALPTLESLEQAERALSGVAAERALIEARHADSERECYAKFFVNNCRDVADETRRTGLIRVRAIEVQADRFKRQAQVDERDRELALAQEQTRMEQAERAARPPKPPRPEIQDAPHSAPHAPVDKVAQQAARIEQRAAREAAETGQRAANVAAFEQKQRDSAERERAVAARKAEKAAQQAAKDAAASVPRVAR